MNFTTVLIFFLKSFRYKALYSKLNSCFWLDTHRTETRFDLALKFFVVFSVLIPKTYFNRTNSNLAHSGFKVGGRRAMRVSPRRSDKRR